MDGALFWVGGGRWVNILFGWEQVGKFFGWVGVGWNEWEWVHYLIMPISYIFYLIHKVFKGNFPRFGCAIRELPLAEIKAMVLKKINRVLYSEYRFLRPQQFFPFSL